MKTLVFTSPQCAPCKQVVPILQKLQKEGYPIEFVPFEEPETFIKFGVTNVPTMIIVDGEDVVHRVVGGKDEREILQIFNENGLTSE